MISVRKHLARLSTRARILLAVALLLIAGVATVVWFASPKQCDSWGARVNSWLFGGSSSNQNCEICCHNCRIDPDKYLCYDICQDLECADGLRCSDLNGD